MRSLMRHRKWVLGALFLVGAGLGVAQAGPDTFSAAFDAILQRPVQEKGTVIVPDRFVRPWDPVTIFFDTTRGPKEGGAEGKQDLDKIREAKRRTAEAFKRGTISVNEFNSEAELLYELEEMAKEIKRQEILQNMEYDEDKKRRIEKLRKRQN